MSRNHDSEPIADRVSRLATEAMREQTRLLRDSVEFGRSAFDRDADQAALSRAWIEALTEQSQAYWQAVGSLGLDVAARLVALNTRTAAAVLERLTEATGRDNEPHLKPRPGGAGTSHEHDRDHGHHQDPGHHQDRDHDAAHHEDPAPTVGASRRYSLSLSGRVGGTAGGTVTVVNRHPRNRRVLLTAGLLRDVTADSDTSTRLTVSPAHVTLPPGQEAQVRVSAELTDPALRAGQVYAATVEVSGGDEALIDVAVAVDP